MSEIVRDGSEFRINSLTFGEQLNSDTTILSDGRFVVTWASPSQDGFRDKLSGQYYSNSGTAIGAEFLIKNPSASEYRDAVTVLSDGRFVVSWISDQNYAQIYDQSLNPTGERIHLNNDFIGTNYGGDIAALANGGFAYYTNAGFQQDFLGETFNADGVLTGTFTSDDGGRFDFSPTLAALNDGSVVYAWEAGPLRFGPFPLPNALETSFGFSRIGASNPALAKTFDGGFILTWTENGGTFGQRFDKTAAEVGADFSVKSGAITGLADDSFIATFEGGDGSGLGIYAQRYSSSGTAIGAEFRINTFTTGDQTDASVSASVDGGFVVSWTSAGQDGSGTGVYAQRFDLVSTVDPLPAAPPASAKPASYFYGTAGNDTLIGNQFANALNGGGGQDKASGGIGDDTYNVESMGDTVVEKAGEGIDTVESWGSYVLSANVENLKLLGIGLTGTGNDLANRITGGKGNDTLNGKAGNDWLTGGAGADTFVFEKGTGHDVVTDFATMGASHDVANLHAFGFTSFAQIQAAMSQVGADTQLVLSEGSHVSFLGHTISQFEAGDFVL